MAASPPFDVETALAPLRQHHSTPKRSDVTFVHAISTAKRARTRHRTQHSLSQPPDNDATATDKDACPSSEGSYVAVNVVKRRKRTPTHLVHQKAKRGVLNEIQEPESRLAYLRQQHGIEDPNVVSQRWTRNKNLQEAIVHHDLMLASTQSALTGFVNARVTSPIETYIHLTKDWDQRCAVLLGMKDRKIREAHHFLIERTRHMDLRKQASEVSHFEAENGNLCVIKIDVTHFEGVASVRQVFDALQFYYVNLEISFTETTGVLAVRENEEGTEKSVLHHRLCFTHPLGILLEKNAVCFMDSSELELENPDDHSAVIVGDFVNQDDLYPYCPLDRARKDVTSAFKLSAFRRPKASRMAASSPTAGQQEETELVVVLTQWYLVRTRNPEISVDKNVLQSISNEHPSGFDVMIKSMRQGMRLSSYR